MFTISYNANGGTGSTVDPVQPGTTYAVKSPMQAGISYPGYSFTIWDTAADGSGISYTPGDTITVTADMTFYALWQPLADITVTYNANGGMGSAVDTVQSGSAYVIKNTVQTGIIYPGHTFNSWNTASDNSGIFYSPNETIIITASLTLFAIWQPNPAFTISYHPNGGTGDTADTALSGTTYTVKSPTDADIAYYPGYTFAGWNTVPDSSETPYAPGNSFTVTADLTLYAQWQTLPDVSVTYNANGGTGSATDNVQPYTVYTVKSPVQTGIDYSSYILTSWNTAPDGSGSSYIPGYDYTVSAGMTLYAIWQPMPALSVYYYANDGAGVALNFVQPYKQYTVLGSLQTGTARYGYTFIIWNTASDGSGTTYSPGSILTMTENLTLYAIWQIVPKFTVNYLGNGGGGGGSYSDTMYTGTVYTIKSQKQTGVYSFGFLKFGGWNTAFDDSGTPYSPGDTIIVTADITLYAIWYLPPELTLNNHLRCK